MIRNFFKERREEEEKERQRQRLEMSKARSIQIDILVQKMRKIVEDKRLYDTTYIIYSSEFPNLEYEEMSEFVWYVCNVCCEVSPCYSESFYNDIRGGISFAFYIYVRKREEPKYNVGDVVHCRVGPYRIEADVIVLGRTYDDKGRYKYIIPSEAGIEWNYLDDIEKGGLRVNIKKDLVINM